MKKFLIGLLVLCLVVIGVLGLTGTSIGKSPAVQHIVSDEAADATVIGGADSPTEIQVTGEAAAEPETAAAEPETAAAAEPETAAAEANTAAAGEAQPEQPDAPSTVPEEPAVASGRINYEALYSLYAPEEKVLKVNDKEETWGDYFYILFTQCGQIEQYFDSMSAYYGMQFHWDEPVEEKGEGDTYAEAALESVDNLMIQLGALEKFAEENGVEVSEEMRGMIEAQKQQDITSALGEEGTEEAFYEYLEQIHLSRDMYDRIVTQNYLYQESFNRLYGENAVNLPDEAALKFLEDNGYVTVAHILLLNTDEESGEKLDEAALAEKKAELEALVSELRAIEDDTERKEAFLQKVTELSEDPGSARYPEGYTYTAGTMVPEFEAAAEALEDYAVSDVVETSYGYHILMRLPLSPDAIVEFSSTTGEARTARMLAANQEYAAKLQATADELKLEWLPGHEQPDLLNYVAE